MARAPFVAALLAACAGRSDSPVTVQDNAGVTIVDSRSPVEAVGSRVSVDSLPLVDISGAEGGRGEFGPGILVARFPAEPLVVAERRVIRWYDRHGSWLRSSGRDGSGPGEFRQIDLLRVFGDSVLVYDLALRRVSVYDTAGQLGRITTIAGGESDGGAFPLGVLADGRLLLGTYSVAGAEPGLRRDSVTLRIGGPTGVAGAEIGRFPWVDQVVEPRAGGVAMRRVVFARTAFWATFGVEILVATNERFDFDWYDADGRLLRSARRRWTPAPVTDADVREQVEEWLESFPAGMEERKAAARELFSGGPRPAEKPPYDGVVVTDAGDVWVLEYDEPGQRGRPSGYSVFDRAGVWRTRAIVPAGVRPVVIGTADMVGTWRDSDGAVHVRVYRVRHE